MRETIQERPETLWGYAENNEKSPRLILAQILEQRGLDVWISGVDTEEPYMSGLLAIHASPEGRKALSRAENLWEFILLKEAYQATNTSEPNVMGTYWDEPTARRIKAFFWQNRAEFNSKKAAKIDQVTHGDTREVLVYQLEAAKARLKAHELLYRLSPLTPDDIRSLIEQVVDRELAPTQR